MPRPRGFLCAFLLGGLVAACGPQASDCGRDCLVGVAEDYLEAIAANDPALANLADDIAFVENITRLDPGEGLWADAAGRASAFRIFVPDPEQNTVGLITIIDRRSAGRIVPAMLAARLTIEADTITEAEHLVADLTEEADLAALQSPRSDLITDVPEASRMTHDELVAIAGSYYDALDESDGSLAPFAADCEREENGMITASYRLGPASFASVDVNGRSPPPVARDCVGQMNSRRFAYIDSIDHRRIVAADPVLGLAMGFSHFRQSMANGPHRMIAADGSEVMWDELRDPYDLPAAHILKITDGEIHEVEAIGIFVPYDSPTGWE